MRLPPTMSLLRRAPPPRPSSLRLNLLLCAAGLWAGASLAQPGDAPQPVPVTDAAPADGGNAGPARIGDATRALLELQRGSRGPARPIPGEQAGLSYQRYLDSFRQPIPDALASTVQRGQGSAR